MSISKQIRVNDGSNREFETITTSELQFDLVPEVGSFRPVVSDGVAKALEVATEIPVVTAETNGKVLKASWNAETSTGSTEWGDAAAPYTAGTGIDIQNGEISVKHDSTLTDVGGRQTVELTPSIEFNYHEHTHEQWEWSACAVTVPVPGYIGDMNFSFESWSGLNYPDMAGKQVVGIVSKPGDTTAYYVVQLKDSMGNDVFVDSYSNLPGGTYRVPSYGGRASIYIQNLTEDVDAIVDGKVTLCIGFYDTDQNTLVTNQYSQGPLYNGVPLNVFWLARTSVSGSGETPVEPGPDAVWGWETSGSVPLNTTIGEGTASLSVANPVPSYTTSEDGKVLGVVDNVGTAELQWVSKGGGSSYTAGDGIKIESNTVSAYHGETLVDKALPLAFKTGADSRASWNPVVPQVKWTAIKVEFGNIVPSNTILGVSIKNRNEYPTAGLAMPHTTVDPDLGGKKVKLVFANPDNPSNYIEANSAANVEVTQNYNPSYQYYSASIELPSGLFYGNFQSGFNWHDLTLADIQGADGSTLMYVAVCATDGTLVTTGSCGPTNNLWTVGFGNYLAPSADTYALVTMPSNPVGFEVKNPVPDTGSVVVGSVLAMYFGGIKWVAGGVPYYIENTSSTVGISINNEVVTSTADVTNIIVYADVKSAIVQWTVASTTTLPTVTDGTNPLKASVNNPASLTVGRTVQVSILNGTWVCAEFA